VFIGEPRTFRLFSPGAATAIVAYIYQRLTETAENDVVRAWNRQFADRNP
jgi:hypothetical protein